MLWFALWAMLFIGGLTGAGYSHYRYRVRNNQYYAWLFARDREDLADAGIKNSPRHSYAVPVLTIAIICLLVPMSLVI
jgi:hypothetical protein